MLSAANAATAPEIDLRGRKDARRRVAFNRSTPTSLSLSSSGCQEYRTSLAINENGGVWYSLGRLYGSEGRNAEALQALERAAGLSLQPFTTYMTIGKLQLAMNQPEQALVSCAKAEETSPYRNGGESLAPEVYAELAEARSEAHRRLNHWSEAIAFQQEAIQRTPSVARRWDRLARLYEANGQTKLADEVRQRMLQMQGSENPSSTVNK